MRRAAFTTFRRQQRAAVRLCATYGKNAGLDAAAKNAAGGKDILFGGRARERMLAGVERISRAVAVTLGPKGRNVVIRLPDGEPKITKDGVTVARSIEFTDHFEDVGAMLIRQVAGNTNDVAGDGTTTATILAWSMFTEGYKSVATGANPMDLKRGIDSAVAAVVQSITDNTRQVKSHEDLVNVAAISANNEREIGKLIAAAVTRVGVDGYVSLVDGRTRTTELEDHKGWSVERGFVSPLLVTDTKNVRAEFDEVMVFLIRENVTTLEQVLPLLEAAKAANKPMLLLAPQVSGDALETMIYNHRKGIVSVIGVELASGEDAVFDDLAAYCGATVIESFEELEHVKSVQAVCGAAKEFFATMDSCGLQGSNDCSARVNLLRKQLERVPTESEREQLCARIAKLTHNYAVIRVGGASIVEINETKDRIIDALNATKAALSEGIVAGGGSALLWATKVLDTMLMEDMDDLEQDRRSGILIVRNAIRLPMKHIADNAGVEGPVILENVLELASPEMGYDAQNDVYVNMFDAGIIDPLRVVRSCIVDAASVAGLMITTEATVCDESGNTRDSKWMRDEQ